eukprot:Skav220551  [mRNA]  locus=scaffold761:184541:189440:+ [translate_table: standard]
MLMPNAAFCTGLQTIAKFEAARASSDAAATAEEAALEGPSANCAAVEEVPQAELRDCRDPGRQNSDHGRRPAVRLRLFTLPQGFRSKARSICTDFLRQDWPWNMKAMDIDKGSRSEEESEVVGVFDFFDSGELPPVTIQQHFELPRPAERVGKATWHVQFGEPERSGEQKLQRSTRQHRAAQGITSLSFKSARICTHLHMPLLRTKDQIGLAHYGLSMVKLEEIMKITN